MILHDLPPGTTLFRAHTPQWASRPIAEGGLALHRSGPIALHPRMPAPVPAPYNPLTISTCAIPASSNSGPRGWKPARR
jgi:hypothetical protein